MYKQGGDSLSSIDRRQCTMTARTVLRSYRHGTAGSAQYGTGGPFSSGVRYGTHSHGRALRRPELVPYNGPGGSVRYGGTTIGGRSFTESTIRRLSLLAKWG